MRHALAIAGVLSGLAWAGATQAFDPYALKSALEAERERQATWNAERATSLEGRRVTETRRVTATTAAARVEEAALEALRGEVADNAAHIEELETRLAARSADLESLAANFRQAVGDLTASLAGSLVSAQLPERDAGLRPLAAPGRTPNARDIEALWLAMLGEISAAARIGHFEAPVIGVDGVTAPLAVTRIGPFTAVADGTFLVWSDGTLRQLAARRLARARSQTAGQFVHVPVDPTRGVAVWRAAQRREVEDVISTGGPIAYVILGLGLAGALLVVGRSVWLGVVARRMQRQSRAQSAAHGDNPLGRLLLEYNRAMHLGDLARRLDEVVIREAAWLQRGQPWIRLLAAVAPMLGLLGTVTGMISTFQLLAIFGTGDPLTMANGISQALVTTLLGLSVAIPLLLGHGLVAARSQRLVQLLDQTQAELVGRTRAQRDGLGREARL